jgi:TRAP-type mannitol/chloroaromatic compound transport system permease small subunit
MGARRVKSLLAFSRWVDWVNQLLGKVADWLVLLACVVSAGNAMVRYAYDLSSNAWLELLWYMFAWIVMLGASYTLKKNEHVRVDIFYMTLSRRGQIWVDIIGTVLFLLPACLLLAWLSWPFFLQSFPGEMSTNAGGLLRWPVKFLVPAGFVLLALQGFSELVKRVAALQGHDIPDLEVHYERPLQ